ncbi:MAG: hypothetical protein ACYCS7_07955 [Acidimicrobiales bacterium]
MGLLDKVKAQAEQAMTKAQQGMTQGQAKLDQMQAKRHSDALLRDLGAACFAEQRQGGPAEAVVTALAALDEFVATQGPIDLSPGAAASSSFSSGPGFSATGGPSADPAAPGGTPAAGTPEGDFTLDGA